MRMSCPKRMTILVAMLNLSLFSFYSWTLHWGPIYLDSVVNGPEDEVAYRPRRPYAKTISSYFVSLVYTNHYKLLNKQLVLHCSETFIRRREIPCNFEYLEDFLKHSKEISREVQTGRAQFKVER